MILVGQDTWELKAFSSVYTYFLIENNNNNNNKSLGEGANGRGGV